VAGKDRSGDDLVLRHTSYELFIGAVSVLSIVNLGLIYIVQDQGLDDILMVINVLLTGLFVADFVYRMYTAPSRSRYFVREFGWADLLACVPVAQFKVLRVFRLVKVGRLLRAYGARGVMRLLVKNRAGSALFTLLFLAILVLQFGSLGELKIEQYAPGANITTPSDALWYSIVTMSTVGYGDQYPVTTRGRLLGSFIILVGVGIFGALAGYLANAFVGAPKGEPEAPQTASQVRRNVADLRAALEHQGKLLEEIERGLPDEAGRAAEA